MTDLITKLEEAGEGSRALDALVYCAFNDGWRAGSGNQEGAVIRSGAMRMPESVTQSLDAALALASRVLPGWFPAVEPRFFIDGEVVRWKATLIRPLWGQYNPVTDEWFDRIENRTASTPALALCAAILRASEEKQS